MASSRVRNRCAFDEREGGATATRAGRAKTGSSRGVHREELLPKKAE